MLMISTITVKRRLKKRMIRREDRQVELSVLFFFSS